MLSWHRRASRQETMDMEAKLIYTDRHVPEDRERGPLEPAGQGGIMVRGRDLAEVEQRLRSVLGGLGWIGEVWLAQATESSPGTFHVLLEMFEPELPATAGGEVDWSEDAYLEWMDEPHDANAAFANRLAWQGVEGFVTLCERLQGLQAREKAVA